MIVRSKQGTRRVSPSVYKLLLTAHIIVSVGWLGVVAAKLALALAAATTSEPGFSSALYASMQVVNPIFPPAAISTIVTGVLLSLGTKWGLLDHYWIVAKLVLTVAVIVSAFQLGDRFTQQAIAAPSGAAIDGAIIPGITWAQAFVISMSLTHGLMLGIATVLSVYKPWGQTWFGRRKAMQRSRPEVTGYSFAPGQRLSQ